MNEQIRELALQAGGDFWQRLENDAVVKDAYVTFDPPAALEKFAELLVKECLNIVDDEGAGEGGSVRAIEKIKQRFGVEE